MNKVVVKFFFLLIFTLIMSCTQSQDIKKNLKIELDKTDPISLYSSAMIDLNEKKYNQATLKFNELILRYPLSNEGIQSKIMLAFIDYLNMDYFESINKFDKIINLYPSHKSIDYAYYMRAMCYFEQIENEELDGYNNKQSLNNFKKIINLFPESKYARDSEQKIIFIKENIAAKHMNIALFYLKQDKYLAALNRYNIVINEYSKSKFTPEALFRLVEIYYSMGMIEDAKKTSAVIAYNYPKSKWYKYAYNLMNEDDLKKNKLTLKKRLSNIFNKNANKQ